MSVAVADRANPPAKLGEELPVFCEHCGYSLHGLTQVRCDACTVLQFHCPECGHHQPINTLRPAAQRIIGRMRAVWLGLVILFKLNFFGWFLFIWGVAGSETSYRYYYAPQQVRTPTGQIVQRNVGRPSLRPEPVQWPHFIVFGMFALPFGMVSRMLLLRWQRGSAVGVVIAVLVMTAIIVGVKLRGLDLEPARLAALPPDFPGLIAYAGALTCLGAMVVWPIWMAVVKVLLPTNTGAMLLEWQRSQSSRPVAALGKE